MVVFLNIELDGGSSCSLSTWACIISIKYIHFSTNKPSINLDRGIEKRIISEPIKGGSVLNRNSQRGLIFNWSPLQFEIEVDFNLIEVSRDLICSFMVSQCTLWSPSIQIVVVHFRFSASMSIILFNWPSTETEYDLRPETHKTPTLKPSTERTLKLLNPKPS